MSARSCGEVRPRRHISSLAALVILLTALPGAILALTVTPADDRGHGALPDGARLLFASQSEQDQPAEDEDDLLSEYDDDDLLTDDEDLLSDDDDLLSDDDDLLTDDDMDAPEEAPADEDIDVTAAAAALAHEQLFLEDTYPSATSCATCHPGHYREWSASQHAYAQLSPIFNAMHGTIVKLTNGTNGDFCIRCHTPVGMNLNEPVYMSNMDRHPTSREGVTCIVCHRQTQEYGKLSGRLAIAQGDILEPVYGPTGNEVLAQVLEQPDKYRVVTTPDAAGRKIHTEAIKFDSISHSGFCGTCHDVTLINGFRLEEAFSHYKRSPAAARGVSCQDCHMGLEPGLDSGYATGPAAIVGGVPTPDRKRTNHYFAGPDYPIIHPGLFPLNTEAQEMATMREWIEFDDKAGWGTDEFEDNVPDDYVFPDRWRSIDDRYDARAIIEDNQELLEWGAEQRLALLKVGYVLGDIVTEDADEKGIKFKVQVKNGTDGHAVPTGFDAERLVWLEVVVHDADGHVVMESGDLDPNGDVRDLHSLYVHNGELPLDKQLFSLQGKFVTRNERGGEREQVLTVNYSPDPLPFIRPSARSSILLGRPAGARKHRKSIAPLDDRWATYRVKSDEMTGAGPYTATVRLKAAMVPVNLLSEIMLVGFDYNMTPRELADGIREGHLVLWEREVEFDVHGETKKQASAAD